MTRQRLMVAGLLCLGLFSACNVTKAQSPSLDYILMSKGWQVYGNLGYRATLLLNSQGGLIGVSVSLSNLSNRTALTLSRLESLKLPFYLEIMDSKGRQLLPDPPDPRKWPTQVQWMLPPRDIAHYFIAVNKLLPEDFETNDNERYRVVVRNAVIEQEVSPFIFSNVSITGSSFFGSGSGERAFQKAMKAAELPGPTHAPKSFNTPKGVRGRL